MNLLRKTTSAFFTLIILLSVFLAYGSINNRWYRVVTVEGNSMSPTLWYGDLMVVTPPPEEIPANTIVVISVGGNLVTHRFLGYDLDGIPITKGDANDSYDQFSNPDLRIVGIYRFRLPGFGYPILYLARLLSRT
jgi:signal peptidase I